MMMPPAFMTTEDQVKTLNKAGLRKFLVFARIRRVTDPHFDKRLISVAQKMRKHIFTDERLALVKTAREIRKVESVEEQIIRLFHLELDLEEAKEQLRTMELLIKETEADIERIDRLQR